MIDPARAASELRDLAIALTDRIDVFLASRDDGMFAAINEASTALVERMAATDPGSPEGRAAAWRVLPLVIDSDVVAPMGFWSSDLGRLVARHIGVGRPVATRLEAAAVLGFTRQRVHQMLTSGALRKTPGGIDNDSLVAHIALAAPSV